MKRLIVMLLAVWLFTALYAFDEGTINAGGTTYLSSTKYDANDDPTLYFVVAPQLGYFILKNVALDIVPMLGTYSQSGKSDGTSYTYSGTQLGIGLGGRVFYQNFYGGMLLQYVNESYESKYGTNRHKDKSTALYLTPKLGMVMPIVKNVYGDLGISYNMGIGKVKETENHNGTIYKDNYKNEYQQFQFLAGLQIFFPLNEIRK